MNELVDEPGGLEAAAGKLAGEMLATSRLGLQVGAPLLAPPHFPSCFFASIRLPCQDRPH